MKRKMRKHTKVHKVAKVDDHNVVNILDSYFQLIFEFDKEETKAFVVDKVMRRGLTKTSEVVEKVIKKSKTKVNNPQGIVKKYSNPFK